MVFLKKTTKASIITETNGMDIEKSESNRKIEVEKQHLTRLVDMVEI